ncbi:MAG: hypothetical protein IJU79_00135 [Desulfovibrionaceae bacterium]|nr:hypothetical protein [Desulfovibrionaceae bacterium]
MKFFNLFSSDVPSLLRPMIFLIAVCIAIGMWYVVVYHDTADFEIEIIINYKGLPNKLFVTSGLVYHVRERVRGPKMLKNALPETFDLPIDISGLKVGDSAPSNVFSVIDEQRKLFASTVRRAFQILYIDPPVIRLSAEYIDRINMPITINFISDSQIIIKKISNQSIALSGPESEIKKLERLSTFPINVSVDFLDVGKTSVVKDIPIFIAPDLGCPHVTAEPSSIKVEYAVKGERVNIVRLYPISLSVADASLYKIHPELVQLKLTVPSNKQKDDAYLNELRVTALPPDLNIGESKQVRLNFTPPDGMEIVNEQHSVVITRISNEPKNVPHAPKPQVREERETQRKEPRRVRQSTSHRKNNETTRHNQPKQEKRDTRDTKETKAKSSDKAK